MNNKTKAAKGSGKGMPSSKASYRVKIADKAVSAAKKSGSAQDKRIAKKAIQRKRTAPGAAKRNVY
jgi:hypothetical protein